MKYHARTDANQSAIVKALRDMGATVQPLHAVGKGCPDLLVGWKGANLLVEVKDGEKPPSAQTLTPDQDTWHSKWAGQKIVVNSIDAAIELLRSA